MKYLTVGDEYYEMVERVALQIWENREELIGKIISWDEFLTDFVMDTVPEPDSLEEKIYKERRNNYWKDGINAYLTAHGYPCQLFKARGQGLILKINSKAASASVLVRMTQQASLIKRSIIGLTALSRAEYNPSARRSFIAIAGMMTSIGYQLIGTAEIHPHLSTPAKFQIKKILQKALVDSAVELEKEPKKEPQKLLPAPKKKLKVVK